MLTAYILISAVLLIVGFAGLMSYYESVHRDPTNKEALELVGVAFGWPLLFPIWIGMGFIFVLIATYRYLASNL